MPKSKFRHKLEAEIRSSAQQGGVCGGSRFAVEKSQLDSNLQDIKSRRIFQDLAQNFLSLEYLECFFRKIVAT